MFTIIYAYYFKFVKIGFFKKPLLLKVLHKPPPSPIDLFHPTPAPQHLIFLDISPLDSD